MREKEGRGGKRRVEEESEGQGRLAMPMLVCLGVVRETALCVCCRYLLGRCVKLTELSVGLGEAIDVDTLLAVSTHCQQLQVLRLYAINDAGLSPHYAYSNNNTCFSYWPVVIDF